ncbi:heterokaryon incompatibility protein-domain-containing protein [Podospora didyma]|uniref:Heterokaryon incompatibility protein-domain-containing protein n=1 Tax=Podospora didyma TaxID=330526 RepID=A0AAE0TV94_9PEZI|nr:heterokaryon incompatibility protein-domain-containing protein [Podospora didyma]
MAQAQQHYVDPLDDEPDEQLICQELPKPEVRAKRGDPHLNRREIKDLWYKAVDQTRKNQSRYVPINEFQYSKLEPGEIRLLSLRPYKRPDDINSPLVARVFTRKLSEVRQRYEALSYCWGDQNVKRTHVINLRNLRPRPVEVERNLKPSVDIFRAAVGHLKSHQFPIYKSLYHALMGLRRMVQPVIIWVDAICIDQSEGGEEEKRQQLQIMDQIYHSAANVCIWLGTGFEGSTDGISLAREMINFQTFDKLIQDGDKEKRWQHLIRLLKSSWFSRRWVIQEAALAREATIHCGADSIHWEDFAEAVSLLMDSIGPLRRSFRDEIFDDVETTSGFVLAATLNSVCRKSDEGDVMAKLCDLETLVSTLLGFQATHPKDAIFSVISLARDPPEPNEKWEKELHADQLRRLSSSQGTRTTNPNQAGDFSMLFKYQLSTRDVFIAFVTRCIYNSKSLDILCRHWAPPVLDKYGLDVAMPSWISPLTRSPFGLAGTFKGRQNGNNFVAYSPSDRRRLYRAAGNSEAVISMVDDWSPVFDSRFPLLLIPTLSINSNSATITGGPVAQSPLPSPSTEKADPSELLPTIPESVPEPQARVLSSNKTPPPPKAKPPRLEFSFPSKDKPDAEAGTGTANSPTPSSTEAANLNAKANAHAIHRRRKSSLLQRKLSQNPDMERTHSLSGILSVRGFIIGRIRTQSEIMRGGIIPGEWVRKLGWTAEDDSNRVPELLWRTIVADRTPTGGIPPLWYKRACLHALVDPRNTDGEGNLHSVTQADRQISEKTTLFLRRVECVVWNRRLFEVEVEELGTTRMTMATGKEGRGGGGGGDLGRGVIKGPLFGVGPSGSEVGHLVCILLGCSVPVVLEPSKREGLFRVAGEAYVHGIMDGEAMGEARILRDFPLE